MSDLIAPVRMSRWDTGTLTWVVWDGSLTTGALTIGAVTQSGTWISDVTPVTSRFDYVGLKLLYIGTASPGSSTASAVWRTQKYLYTGVDVTSVLYADGNAQFDNVWDDRASLSYS
jgi:hypothetical protein